MKNNILVISFILALVAFITVDISLNREELNRCYVLKETGGAAGQQIVADSAAKGDPVWVTTFVSNFVSMFSNGYEKTCDAHIKTLMVPFSAYIELTYPIRVSLNK